MRRSPPPPSVLRAFGATHAPMLLAGGMGGTWRSGEIVLKRWPGPFVWAEWEARVVAAARTDGVRVPQVLRAPDGTFMVDGWVARTFLVGSHRPGLWPEIIEAGDAFHAALASVPDALARPPVDPRQDPWAIADRVAWDELPVPAGAGAEDAGLIELLDARAPVTAPSQLVHGDLTGNVLFADGLAPGIIDFSPYWRPTAYAIAVVVVDAVVWQAADLSLVEHVAERPGMAQCLIRALIFRHVTALLLGRGLPAGDAERRYARLREAAIRLR